MKKILILAMCCNQDFFIEQENYIKELYAKDIIEGKYPNIEFYTYTASYDTKYHINKTEHKLYVPADDTLTGTFEKTQNVFRLLKHLNFDYDYVLRTNCSTYINVELLNRFINEITLDDKKIYTGSIYLSEFGTGPYNWCFYGVGNALLLSKFWIDIILKTNPKNIKNYVKTKDEIYYKIDDNTIGLIVNDYAFNHNMDMYDIWNKENNRDNEKLALNKIHEHIKKSDINKVNLNNILTEQFVHILIFDKGMHNIVSREFANEFLYCVSLVKYLEKISKNK